MSVNQGDLAQDAGPGDELVATEAEAAPEQVSAADELAAEEQGEEGLESEMAPTYKLPDELGEDEGDEVDLLGDNVPEWLKEFDGQDKPFSVKKEDLDRIYNAHDPATAQVLHNLRRMAQNATRAANERAASLVVRERQQASAVAQIEQMQQQVVRDRAQLYAMFQSPELRKLVAPPEGAMPPDEFSEEGSSWRAQKAFSERMQGFLDAMQGLSQKEQQAYEAHTAELQKKADEAQKVQRKAEIQEFIDSHPDFKGLQPEIIQLRQERGYAVTAEEAYHLVKARKASAASQGKKLAPTSPRQPTAADQARAAMRATNPPKAANIPSPPPGLTIPQLADWYEKNPEAMERDFNEARR